MALKRGRYRAGWVAPLCAVLLGVAPVASVGHAAQGEPPPNPWYVAHTFVGIGACLQIEKGGRLDEGDSVLVFEAAKPAGHGRIVRLLDVAAAESTYKQRGFDGVYRDKTLWDSIGCYWFLRSGTAVRLARVGIASGDMDGHLAVQGLPASGIAVGSDGTGLDGRGLDSVASQVGRAVPAEYMREGNLRAGRRYVAGRGHELVEAFLGRPFYNTRGSGAPIDSIHICRVFLCDGRLLAAGFISRVSGEEERVETAAPELDENNWFEAQEQTMGFISLDGGTTWDWVYEDVGFEGFDWGIVRLVEGLPPQWGNFLYTLH